MIDLDKIRERLHERGLAGICVDDIDALIQECQALQAVRALLDGYDPPKQCAEHEWEVAGDAYCNSCDRWASSIIIGRVLDVIAPPLVTTQHEMAAKWLPSDACDHQGMPNVFEPSGVFCGNCGAAITTYK